MIDTRPRRPRLLLCSALVLQALSASIGLLILGAAPASAVDEPTGGTAAPPVNDAAAGDVSAPKRAAIANPSSCVQCHGKLEGAQAAPADAWSADVHGAAGLGCEACHGGDPSPALAEDPDGAMNPAKGFLRAPDRLHIADFCARCHADATYMKQFNPQARVDQLAEYRTSVHGKLNSKGDPVPATCIDCHGSHGIRPVSSPDSPVYATNVPRTCARCHSDVKAMEPYKIPTNQFDDYRRSMHAAALLDRGDTAAPACNDCHGNHGATPPGVKSVANVCGQCHGREATLFGASFKKDLFQQLGAAECTVCHDHHKIHHPTPELFHGASAPRVTKGKVSGSDPFVAEIGDLAAGEKASATWGTVLHPHTTAEDTNLVHTIEISAEGMNPLVVDATIRPGEIPPVGGERRVSSPALSASLSVESMPGFAVAPGDAILFRLDLEAGPGSGAAMVRVKDLPGRGLDTVRGSACLTCHSPGDDCDKATEKMYAALAALDRELRQSEARLRKAELAGMEVSTPQFELKSKGTTAAVEARALIHSFDPDRLVKRTDEGRKVAASALAAADAALDELQYRRKGLAVSLILVALVLVALALKIRQVDRGKAEQAL